MTRRSLIDSLGAAALLGIAPLTAHAQTSDSASAGLPAPVLRVEQLADSLGRTGGFSGVVLIEKDGAVVFERAYGVADSAAHRMNDTKTRFDVSSVGKLFTQTAVQQLIEAGRMHPDSTIAAYWPDYPNPDVAHRVTIRQLLQHRSGLYGDFFVPDRVGALRHNRDYLRWFVHDTLHFTPGTQYEYSNAGYVVLGELVARVSGEDYYAYLQHHIFDPAGMTQTRFDARDSLPPTVAVAYTTRTDERSPVRGSAAGGAYSTADDLLRFLVARRNHVIVRRGGGGGAQFGGSVGSSTLVAEGLAGGYGLIILANQDPPIAATLAAPMLPEKH